MVEFNKDLDFITFSTNIVKEIDSIRSSGKDGDIQESRINALYRAIGLPAIVTDARAELLKFNNNNIFDKITDEDIINGLKNREVLYKTNHTVKMESSDPRLKTLFDFNSSSIKDSISGDSSLRAQLFPMCNNANVDIFPQGKRVGGAFMTDEGLQFDKTKHYRPLIETIIILRSNALGNFNSGDQNKIIAQGDLSKEFVQISKDIEYSLILSLSNVVVDMTDVKKTIDRCRKQTSDQVVPSATPDQNTDIAENTENPGEIDRVLKEQKQYIALKDARLSMFGFDDTIGVGELKTRNLKDAVMASSLINIIFSDSGQIETSIKEIEKKKEKVTVSLKQTFRDLDLILGTFSGLSGTDVLVILFALFRLDVTSLMQLLNKDARIRLKGQLGLDYVESFDDSASVIGAIKALETKVEKIINALSSEMEQTKHKNKDINKISNIWESI